jgi:hypothetical protein
MAKGSMLVDEPTFDGLVRDSAARLLRRLNRTMPSAAALFRRWLLELLDGSPLSKLLLWRDRFPMLQLPLWVDASLARRPAFQLYRDLTYSTISGYLFIRLVDELMDANRPTDVRLLSGAGFLHWEFHQAYVEHVPSRSPFWARCRRLWYQSGEAIALESQLSSINRRIFTRIAEGKLGPALIPVIAICLSRRRPRAIQGWMTTVRHLSRFEQLLDDTLDFHEDLHRGAATYMLSTYRRRRRRGELPVSWYFRDGMPWSFRRLFDELRRLKQRAERQKCVGLQVHLARRADLLRQLKAVSSAGHS